MRAVGLSDLDLAARAVLSVPPERRAAFIARLLDDAHTSDLWRKRRGVVHPNGGTGSLYVQASLHRLEPVATASPAYCLALGVVLQGLEAWRTRCHKVV